MLSSHTYKLATINYLCIMSFLLPYFMILCPVFVIESAIDLADDTGEVKNLTNHLDNQASDYIKDRETLIPIQVQSMTCF